MGGFDMKQCLLLLIFVAFLGIAFISVLETNTWTRTTMLSLIPVLTTEDKRDTMHAREDGHSKMVGNSQIEYGVEGKVIHNDKNWTLTMGANSQIGKSQIEDDVGVNVFHNELKLDVEENKKNTPGLVGNSHIKDGWNIIYNELKLRKQVNRIHDSNYQVKHGDKCTESVPDCIIVGVAKCGTRELVDFMSIHPNIITKHKNGYQISGSIFRRSTARSNIKALMPCKYRDQISVVKADKFLTDPAKPDEIFKINPNMKIIAIIREPTSRVVSHFTFRQMKHGKKMKNIRSKTASYFGNINIDKMSYKDPPTLVKLSMYNEGLERYMNTFKRENVLVIESDEFKTDPTSVIKRVEEFFGIKSFVSNEHYAFNPEKNFYCIRKSESVEKSMVCYESNRGRKHITIDKEKIDALRDYFRPHNEKLYRLIRKRYDW